MNRDTITGIIGAVILVTAMVGVFQYERGRASDVVGAGGSFVNATLAGPTLSDATPLGEATEANVTITQLNLTRVAFALSWTASNGRDTLVLHVTPPEGSGLDPVQSDPSDSGTIEVAVDVPNASPAAGGASAVGTGDWQVVVEYVSGSGLSPVPGVPPVQPDETVSWSLATTLTAWEREAAS